MSPLHLALLGETLRLAEPRALLLLGLPALLLALGVLAVARRRRALAAFGALAPRVAPGAGTARPVARLSLEALGLALLVLSLSRPQCGTRAELPTRHGIDLVLALDVSRSMLARDEAPDRLARAKLEIGDLLDRLRGDRVGLVLFAGEASAVCPLTGDHAAARLLLRGAGPAALRRQGTDLAAGLAAAGEVLRAVESGGRSRAVVLLSDGEDQELGALEAAGALAADGIRVLAVGLGRAEGAPVPALDAAGRASGWTPGPDGPVVSRLDEGRLRAVAERTGGRYFRASGAVGLPALAEELDRMEKSDIAGRMTVTWEEGYALLAFPGFLLLLAGALLREQPRRRAEGSA